MTDMQAHLDKIRSDAGECLLLGSLATDEKKEMFIKIAEHLNSLALEIERTIATNGANVSPAARRAEAVVASPIADSEVAVATYSATPHLRQAARSRRILPWLGMLVAGAVAAAFLWDKHDDMYSALNIARSKQESPRAPQDEAKQAIAELVSGERAERKVITEQLGALAGRLDNLAKALDNLNRAPTEVVGWSNRESIGAGEKPITTETRPSALEDKGFRNEGNGASTPDNTAKPSGAVLPTSGLDEPIDRVGAIATSAGIEPDQRRSSVGPVGCTHFRSFNAASGTYTTIDGRRRPCR
jgi:BA14K-like protein